MRKKKPFIVFDWKRNYRDLRRLPQFKDLVVYTIARNTVPFCFNPLIAPQGTEAGEWLMKLVDVIKHAYFVGYGVESFLRESIEWVYDKCGYFDGTRRNVTTFDKVRDYFYKRHGHDKGRKSLWRDSTMRVLDSLCFKHGLGPVLNTNESLDENVFNKNVIMEVDALPDVEKAFFVRQ